MISFVKFHECSIEYSKTAIRYEPIEIRRRFHPVEIVGSNGSGKSSLILALAGIIPDFIHAKLTLKIEIGTESGSVHTTIPPSSVFVVPQNWQYSILGFNPMEEIQVVNFKNIDWKNHVLEILKIRELNEIPSALLSDGEKKRLAIAKALIYQPELIISDEWCVHLDPYWVKKINQLFDQYFERGGFHIEFNSSMRKPLGHTIDLVTHVSTLTKSSLSVSAKEQTNEPLKLEQQLLGYNNFQPENFQDSINIGILKKGLPAQHIHKGTSLILIGQNGSGKTKMFMKIWKRFSTKCIIKINCGKRRPNLLLIPTDPTYHLLGPLVEDDVERYLMPSQSIGFCSILEKKLGIKSDQEIIELSFGQRKLLAILLGLLSRFQVVAIDEPFAGIDPSNRSLMLSLVTKVLGRGKIILLANQEDIVDLEVDSIKLKL